MNLVRAIACQAGFLALALGQAPDPRQIFQEAVGMQQRGDYASAAEQYRRLVKLQPAALPAWVNLGAALVQLKEYGEAIAAYRTALSLDRGNRDVQFLLALAYFKKGEDASASGQLEEMMKAAPGDVRAATLLGECYLRLGKQDRALGLLAPLAESAGGNPDFSWVLGSALIATGRLREGAAVMERVAKQTNAADAYMLAGRALFRLNEFERAKADLETAARLNPELPGVFAALGSALEKNADNEGAILAFRKELARNAGDFEANFGLGSVLYFERNLEEARGYLSQALRLDPSSVLARYELALVNKAAGQFEDAVADLEKVERADPNWQQIHVELAALYFRVHRPEDGARERQIVDRLSEEERKAGPGALH